MSVEWNPQIKYYISSQEKLIYITFDYPHKETGFNEFMARLVELDKDGNELRLVIAVIISQVHIICLFASSPLRQTVVFQNYHMEISSHSYIYRCNRHQVV